MFISFCLDFLIDCCGIFIERGDFIMVLLDIWMILFIDFIMIIWSGVIFCIIFIVCIIFYYMIHLKIVWWREYVIFIIQYCLVCVFFFFIRFLCFFLYNIISENCLEQNLCIIGGLCCWNMVCQYFIFGVYFFLIFLF